jgi:hypothetical protein
MRADRLLVAGRCFSSDLVANDLLAPIQFYVAMGQAAGTAAALAIMHGVPVRPLDYRLLHNSLVNQGVPLPNIERGELRYRESNGGLSDRIMI